MPQLHQQASDHTQINRLTVTAAVTLESFAELVQGRGLGALRFRHGLLATTKAILGNELYTRIRSVLIKKAAA